MSADTPGPRMGRAPPGLWLREPRLWLQQAQALRVTCSIRAPQLPQNLSPAGTLPRQLGQTSGTAAGLIGVTVAPAPVATAALVVALAVPASLSSLPVAFFNSRRPSPMALPNSGNFPGPKINKT